ncbi:hypothetical protein TSAR_004753 [Trichomalopsis sarcophagae]|uniref:Uncharacterized protein n=1 Tax=Trichomalopsis sarcophagae TaxID=543379 RepID=A0A232FK57_9HYME|nr:hypothetical protein TSAR_004753 [Trichomalopsis sarcophagae]
MTYVDVGAQSKAMKKRVNLQRRLSNDDEESKSTIRFLPIASIQRYEAVVNVLRANNIVTRFPEYEATFHGICDGPPETDNLGVCSQMAVFHKNNDLSVEKLTGMEGLYNPVTTREYPYDIDKRLDEQNIFD